jgi:hypothetical protein
MQLHHTHQGGASSNTLALDVVEQQALRTLLEDRIATFEDCAHDEAGAPDDARQTRDEIAALRELVRQINAGSVNTDAGYEINRAISAWVVCGRDLLAPGWGFAEGVARTMRRIEAAA